MSADCVPGECEWGESLGLMELGFAAHGEGD